nr:hypothetical protein [Candidatus Sigynarchaeota archaeon]
MITQYGEYTGTLFSMIVYKHLLEFRRKMEDTRVRTEIFLHENALRTLLGKNFDFVHDSAAVLNALNGITYKGFKIKKINWNSITKMPNVFSPAMKFLKSVHDDLNACSKVATTISRTVADSLVGAVFFDNMFNQFNAWSKIDTSMPNYKDTPTYQARAGQYAALKARVKNLIVHLPRVGMDISDEARFDRLWAKMEDILDVSLVTGNVFSSSNYPDKNFNTFMRAYFDFMQSFLRMKPIDALRQAWMPDPTTRAEPFASALQQAILTKDFSEYHHLIRFWEQGMQNMVPLIQFDMQRVPLMFKVDEMHRIGNWHVTKVTSMLPEGPTGPITYYMAFRADRGADIHEFGVRVFTTWGTLQDKNDPTVTYQGWARPNEQQQAQLEALLAMSPSTPVDIQERINMLNEIMTPGTQDYVPWTTFISQENDGADPPHATASFADLLIK